RVAQPPGATARRADTKDGMIDWAGKLVVALALAALVGCGSGEPKTEKPAPSPAPDTGASTAKARPAESDPQLEPITIKGRDRRIPEAADLGQREPGNVSFEFHAAPLSDVVCPLFKSQVGVVIDYSGPKKLLDLRLVNVPWRDALQMICQ